MWLLIVQQTMLLLQSLIITNEPSSLPETRVTVWLAGPMQSPFMPMTVREYSWPHCRFGISQCVIVLLQDVLYPWLPSAFTKYQVAPSALCQLMETMLVVQFRAAATLVGMQGAREEKRKLYEK